MNIKRSPIVGILITGSMMACGRGSAPPEAPGEMPYEAPPDPAGPADAGLDEVAAAGADRGTEARSDGSRAVRHARPDALSTEAGSVTPAPTVRARPEITPVPSATAESTAPNPTVTDPAYSPALENGPVPAAAAGGGAPGRS